MSTLYRTFTDLSDPEFVEYIPDIVNLIKECIKYERQCSTEGKNIDTDTSFPESPDEQEINATILTYNAGITLAVDHGKLVGVASAYMMDATRAVLGPVSVSEEYRGCGVGSRLMEFTDKHLKDIGCTSSVLIVLENNPAVAMYKRCGYTDTSIVMSKEL